MPFKAALTIKKFWYADDTRTTKDRAPGACSLLLNTRPNETDGEKVRYGYAAYSDVTAPTGTSILKTVPIQNPAAEDAHVWFGTDGISVYPHYISGVRQAESMLLGDDLKITSKAVTYPTVTQMKFTSPPVMSATVNFYKGWLLVVGAKRAYVTAWDGVDTLTFLEDVDGTGLNFGTPVTGSLRRDFHDNFSFFPAFNNDLANPPCVFSDASNIYISGGQNSSSANNFVKTYPYLKRTFFPGTTRPFTFEGSYSSERRLKPQNLVNAIGLDPAILATLPPDRTYWLGLAAVYDYGQIGELQKYENTAFYTASGDWTQNYLNVGGSGNITPTMLILAGTLNKRITGFAFYLAQDVGDTRGIGRQTPYYFIDHVSIAPLSGNVSGAWIYAASGVTQRFQFGSYIIGGLAFTARGGTYQDDTGIADNTPDTMYAASTEEIYNDRHVLANAYVASEAAVDRQSIFLNPVGGNAVVGNAGIVATDVFANIGGVYRLFVNPTIGSKINAIVATGVEELLICKDIGVIIGRIVTLSTNGYDLTTTILSHEAGCTTCNAVIKDDAGYIYFAGYEDIYRYGGGRVMPMIEREDKNDWLYNYRQNISKATKEACACYYLGEGSLHWDFGHTAYQSFALYPGEGWRQENFKCSVLLGTEFFRWATRLKNGTTLAMAVDSSGTAQGIMQFSNPTTGVTYYRDRASGTGGTEIPYQIDTGDVVLTQDESVDFKLREVAISRTLNQQTSGQLDCALYRDEYPYGGSTFVKTFSDVAKQPGGGLSNVARVQLRLDPTTQTTGNRWRVVINSNSSPEKLKNATTKPQLAVDSIAFFGEARPHRRRINQ